MERKSIIKDNLSETILIDHAYYDALLKDIADAKESITLEAYIFEFDILGKRISDALINAVKRGVLVRVLVDGVGSSLWGDEGTKQMEAAGIETRIFHPFPWKISHWARASHVSPFLFKKIFQLAAKFNTRNHRKICMIDHHILYVGSGNIVRYALKGEEGESWRETTVKLTNIDLSYLQLAFEKVWNHIPLSKRFKLAFKRTKENRLIFLNYTLLQRRRFYRVLLDKINAAKSRIWITNAYFVPDTFVLHALEKAAKRGVDVRILLPHRSDVPMISLVATTFYYQLLKHDVAIYEYLPSMLHAKTLIIDNWFTVGSTNLNSRSFLHDLEIDIVIQSDASKLILEQQFLKDLIQAQKIDYDYLKQLSLFKKTMGRLLLFIRHWM